MRHHIPRRHHFIACIALFMLSISSLYASDEIAKLEASKKELVEAAKESSYGYLITLEQRAGDKLGNWRISFATGRDMEAARNAFNVYKDLNVPDDTVKKGEPIPGFAGDKSARMSTTKAIFLTKNVVYQIEADGGVENPAFVPAANKMDEIIREAISGPRPSLWARWTSPEYLFGLSAALVCLLIMQRHAIMKAFSPKR